MADKCTCKCKATMFIDGIGWVGCSRGVHCGQKYRGCEFPREGSR